MVGLRVHFGDGRIRARTLSLEAGDVSAAASGMAEVDLATEPVVGHAGVG